MNDGFASQYAHPINQTSQIQNVADLIAKIYSNKVNL